MVNLVAHRGLWTKKTNQNTIGAIHDAVENGFSAEIDIRDSAGKIIISHDPTQYHRRKSIRQIENIKFKKNNYLFLDLKSSELQDLVSQLNLKKNQFFVFDAAIPDLIKYKQYRIPYLIRFSEYENIENTALTRNASGICLDSFHERLITEPNIKKLTKTFKILFIISPELHGQKHLKKWKIIKKCAADEKCKNIFLCTDFPYQANEYFNE